jgi:flagellar biosynthesis protein FlhA
LIPLVDAKQGGKLPDRIKAVRRKLTEELGFLIHSVHIRDNLDLPPSRYRISILGVTEGEADLYPDKEMAIGTGVESSSLNGVATKDPAYGMDAIWIRVDQRDYAQSLGYTVVDPGTVIATHMSKLLTQHAGSLLGHEEVQALLDSLSKSAPRLVEDLVPKLLPLPTVVKVLQNLLDEGIPVRDMRSIAETLAEKGTHTQDAEELTAAVRVALRRQITGQLAAFEDTLPVITLDAELEKLRPWLASMVRHTIPLLKVLAYNEIAETKRLKVIANIGGEATA